MSMFYIFTSRYEEAAPVIRRYRLKKIPGLGRFEFFAGDEAVLAVCGCGAINISTAVTYILTKYGAGGEDKVIGLGICPPAGKHTDGDIVLCVKLTDMSTGRDFYPDLLYKHPFNEGALVSCESRREPAVKAMESIPVIEAGEPNNLEDGIIIDSFGAFMYQAALFFVPCHNLHIIKLVSDGGSAESSESDKSMRKPDTQYAVIDGWIHAPKTYERVFSHIYIEDSAYSHPGAAEILAQYPEARIIKVGHYKDVFCKKGQSYVAQKNSQKLILAVNNGPLIRKGSENCDAYGHENFYYCTSVMNCLYDCEYCYLQGMYLSANVVAFVNIEDVLAEVDKMLTVQSLYICLSYGGDLLLFERFGFIRRWIEFARTRQNLVIEIRTKSAAFDIVGDIPVCRNVVFAWTLTPNEYIDRYEHCTPSLERRKAAAASAIRLGWRVRICVDPMLAIEGSEAIYKHFFVELKEFFDEHMPEGLSAGVFRAPEKYIRKMKKQRPELDILHYKFINGTYSDSDKARLLKNVDFC